MSIVSIYFLKHHEIDVQKWDRCIQETPGATLYLERLVLNFLAPGWCALVKGDYDQVMPMNVAKKYGIAYWFQPAFLAHTNIGTRKGEKPDIDAMLSAVPTWIRYWDIDLGDNLVPQGFPSARYTRNNMFINLERSIEEVTADYHALARRKIRKALAAGCYVQRSSDVDQLISFYRTNYVHTNVKPLMYDRLAALFERALLNGSLHLYAAMRNDELVGMYGLMLDAKQAYLVVGGTNEKGKQIGAFALLTATAIQDHTGSHKLFRFEGSDLPGIATFNQKFGAVTKTFVHLRVNRLPWPFRLLKPRNP